jgi:hypothetical protein
MSKKDFIALADRMQGLFACEADTTSDGNTLWVRHEAILDELVKFCKEQNPLFKEARWLAYLNGECGPNGGKR